MPVAEPRAAAPPAPSTAPAPAATKGAASPPVTPGNESVQKKTSLSMHIQGTIQLFKMVHYPGL